MHASEDLGTRRHRYQTGMAIALAALLAMILSEAIWPGWACEFTGCPKAVVGGNPFLAGALGATSLLAVLLAVVESRIDRRGLRDIVDDERRLLVRLRSWRNAYFGSLVGLVTFVLLADAADGFRPTFLVGAVMVSGALALYVSLVALEGE